MQRMAASFDKAFNPERRQRVWTNGERQQALGYGYSLNSHRAQFLIKNPCVTEKKNFSCSG